MILEERLKKATLEAEEILMAVQPDAEACDHEFSPQFERKMEKLIRKRKHPVFCHPMFRAAAAIFLVVLLSSAVILSIPDARATLKGLFYEHEGRTFTYVLTSYVEADDMRTYHLGWIPEGFSLTKEGHSDSQGSATYRNQDGKIIMYIYNIQREDCEFKISRSFVNNIKLRYKETTVNGLRANLFELRHSDDDINYAVIWMNEEQSILFEIYGARSEAEALKLAENVIAKEKEE